AEHLEQLEVRPTGPAAHDRTCRRSDPDLAVQRRGGRPSRCRDGDPATRHRPQGRAGGHPMIGPDAKTFRKVEGGPVGRTFEPNARAGDRAGTLRSDSVSRGSHHHARAKIAPRTMIGDAAWPGRATARRSTGPGTWGSERRSGCTTPYTDSP